MPLNTSDRNAVRAAITNGTSPTFVRESLTLQLATKRIVLAQASGRKTLAGSYYERETGILLPRALDHAAAPVRQGNSEFLTLRGKKRRIRTWDAGENTFNYTSWGIKYYQNRRVEAIVSVPVRISGTNAASGRQWERRGYLPIDQVSGRPMGQVLVRAAASQDEQLAELKAEVMGGTADDGILYEASSEEWRLDPEGPWQVPTMVTQLDGVLPVTTSRLQQSMSNALDRIAGATDI